MAVLTTVGTTKYNSAVANGKKILIKKLVFGSNTGAVSSATTDIGTPVYTFDRVHISQGFSTDKLSFSVYMQLPAVAVWSQVGVYDDTGALIAVERVNITAATADIVAKLFSLILSVARPDVFDSLPSAPLYLANAKNTVKMQRQAATFFEKYVPPALEGQIYKYRAYQATPDWLLSQVNIVETEAEFNQAKNSIPSMEEMFNTWYRFSHNSTNNGLNYPALAAELQGWELTANKELATTINSGSFIGFVSPDKYINYEIDTQIYSKSADDDGGGLMLAFNKEDREYSLSLMRCLGGWGFYWKLIFNYNQGATSQIIANKSDSVKGGDGLYHTTLTGAGYTPTPAYVQNGGWSRADIAIGTRIKASRNGDIITAQCSDFGSTDLLPGSLITINMADYPALAPLRKPASYGYCNISQPSMYWNTTKFIDKDNVILDTRNNKIYAFDGTNWVPTGQTIGNTLGVNKFVYSRVNRKTFYVNGSGVLQRVI